MVAGDRRSLLLGLVVSDADAKLYKIGTRAAAAAEMLAACSPGNMDWKGCPDPM